MEVSTATISAAWLRRSIVLVVMLLLVVGGQLGCAYRLGTTASSFMRQVRENPDPNQRHQAYARLAAAECYTAAHQKEEAVELLAAKLREGKEPVATRAQICRTLGALQADEARPALASAVDDPEPMVRAEACRALGRIGNPADVPLLSRTMAADTTNECRLAAIEALGEVKTTDRRVVDQLLDGMSHSDPAIRLASYRSVCELTDKDLGADPAGWREALPAEPGSPTAIADQKGDATRR